MSIKKSIALDETPKKMLLLDEFYLINNTKMEYIYINTKNNLHFNIKNLDSSELIKNTCYVLQWSTSDDIDINDVDTFLWNFNYNNLNCYKNKTNFKYYSYNNYIL